MKPFTFDELRQARKAHSAYNHGSRTAETVAGERAYQQWRREGQTPRPTIGPCWMSELESWNVDIERTRVEYDANPLTSWHLRLKLQAAWEWPLRTVQVEHDRAFAESRRLAVEYRNRSATRRSAEVTGA